MVGYALSVVPQKPAWLEALLCDAFFLPCSIHLDSKKNEINIFCVDCSASICQHCLPSHRSHRLLQTYITNSAKVVFLNQRPQSRLSKGLGNSCQTCDRVLQEPYRYCSVRCKVDAVKNLSSVLHPCNELQLPEFFTCSPDESPKVAKIEMEEEMYENSGLEESLSSTSSASERGECWISTNATPAMYPLPKKMRSSSNRIGGVISSPKSVLPPSSISRRKGFPHRSPLY